MKATINGDIVEGTPEEIAAYKRAATEMERPSFVTPYAEVVQRGAEAVQVRAAVEKTSPPLVSGVPTKKQNMKGRQYSAEEDSLIAEAYKDRAGEKRVSHKSVKKLARNLGRTLSGVKARASHLGVAGSYSKSQQETKPFPPAPKKSATEDPLPEFPHFRSLNDSEFGQRMLVDIVKSVIANKGQLTMPNDGKIIGITDGWAWRNFVEEFMQQSYAVSTYYGAPNLFRMSITGGKFQTIHYG